MQGACSSAFQNAPQSHRMGQLPRNRAMQAPINPSDINTVQGKYPLQPQLPGGVPGHEGVGRVEVVGSAVSVVWSAAAGQVHRCLNSSGVCIRSEIAPFNNIQQRAAVRRYAVCRQGIWLCR
jgi:threonine dehydrogenase-like Zn-dependent dehydrogenase